MQSPEFKIVPHGSDTYWDAVSLRDEILRKPLNLEFTEEQLAAEHDQIHIVSHADQEIAACLVLQNTEPDKMKMRQVAVRESLQRQGFGRKICQYAEQYCAAQGKSLLYCHARDVAVPFYKKLGWKVVGEEFTEVNIKHYRMERSLSKPVE